MGHKGHGFTGALVAVAYFVLALGVGRSWADAPMVVGVVDHSVWDALLKRYVDDDGMVAYERLAAEAAGDLQRYLDQLARADPRAMPREDQLAFWINAYNAGIVAAILRGYSPESALSRARLFRWYSFPVAGKDRTPDEIEHDIMRPQFREPRIHVAVVCGATSCPKLRREAYRGDRINEQLDDQARRFINDRARNRIDPVRRTVELSSIFKWFADDFAASYGSVADFVARYADSPDRAAAVKERGDDMRFLDYDWSLNAQKARPESGR